MLFLSRIPPPPPPALNRGTHLYTWMKRGTMRVKCLAWEQKKVPYPGGEHRPLASESSTLTIRHLPYNDDRKKYVLKGLWLVQLPWQLEPGPHWIFFCTLTLQPSVAGCDSKHVNKTIRVFFKVHLFTRGDFFMSQNFVWSMYVSAKLTTYPSPNLTLTLTSHFG